MFGVVCNSQGWVMELACLNKWLEGRIPGKTGNLISMINLALFSNSPMGREGGPGARGKVQAAYVYGSHISRVHPQHLDPDLRLDPTHHASLPPSCSMCLQLHCLCGTNFKRRLRPVLVGAALPP